MSVVRPQPDSLRQAGRLISLADARERLGGLSKGAFYALLDRGELATVRVGPRRRFVDARDLEAFIDRNKETASVAGDASDQALSKREAGFPASEPLAGDNDANGTRAD